MDAPKPSSTPTLKGKEGEGVRQSLSQRNQGLYRKMKTLDPVLKDKWSLMFWEEDTIDAESLSDKGHNDSIQQHQERDTDEQALRNTQNEEAQEDFVLKC